MSVIKVAKRAEMNMEFSNGFACYEMLPGCHPDVISYKCVLKAGSRVDPEMFSETEKSQVFFFTKGVGYVGTEDGAFNFDEEAVFVPLFNKKKFYFYAVTDVEYVELQTTLTSKDIEEMREYRMSLPSFRLLTNCDRYVDGCRDPRSVSHNVIIQSRLARVSVGTVEGPGPDKVGTHSHPKQIQWFYALGGGKFTLHADDDSMAMEDGDWAFIPVKAEHSVETAAGDTLRYMWFEIIV
jgi:mannose-6-phosphate isomerase-like protein (cupin superfamily)